MANMKHRPEVAARPKSSLNVLVFGPPLSGKTSVSQAISEAFKNININAGKLLDQASRERTAEAAELRKIIEDGGVVPDDVVTDIIKSSFKLLDETNRLGYTMDGFPRNAAQATAVFHPHAARSRRLPTPDVIIMLECHFDCIRDRVLARKMDPKTGQVYNLTELKNRGEKLPSDVVKRLVGVPADKDEVLARKFERFASNLDDILFVLRMHPATRFFTVDASQPLEVVTANVLGHLTTVRERTLKEVNVGITFGLAANPSEGKLGPRKRPVQQALQMEAHVQTKGAMGHANPLILPIDEQGPDALNFTTAPAPLVDQQGKVLGRHPHDKQQQQERQDDSEYTESDYSDSYYSSSYMTSEGANQPKREYQEEIGMDGSSEYTDSQTGTYTDSQTGTYTTGQTGTSGYTGTQTGTSGYTGTQTYDDDDSEYTDSQTGTYTDSQTGTYTTGQTGQTGSSGYTGTQTYEDEESEYTESEYTESDYTDSQAGSSQYR